MEKSMHVERIRQLERLLGSARDGALLRYSLGAALLAAGDPLQAAQRLREAIERDAAHSASWKLLGKALAEAGDATSALSAYGSGIDAAEAHGDVQAAREMRVFARRIERALAEAAARPR